MDEHCLNLLQNFYSRQVYFGKLVRNFFILDNQSAQINNKAYDFLLRVALCLSELIRMGDNNSNAHFSGKKLWPNNKRCLTKNVQFSGRVVACKFVKP